MTVFWMIIYLSDGVELYCLMGDKVVKIDGICDECIYGTDVRDVIVLCHISLGNRCGEWRDRGW